MSEAFTRSCLPFDALGGGFTPGMECNKTPDPVEVRLFRANTIMTGAENGPDLVEQFGLQKGRVEW